jgi:predicted SPOUT superfamily RNA methylase MTH1
MFEQTREIALWLESTPRNDDYTVLAISPQSKISDNDIEINSIAGSSDLGYSVDSVINLSKVRQEKKDDSAVGVASAMSGFGKYKKKEYEPWNKKDIKMTMTKSRASRSKIEIDLEISKGQIVKSIKEKPANAVIGVYKSNSN